jgi:hypothetical protein
MTFTISTSDIFWAVVCTLFVVGYLILLVIAKAKR